MVRIPSQGLQDVIITMTITNGRSYFLDSRLSIHKFQQMKKE